MTCCHHYSVYTAFAKHIIVPFHPSHHRGLRFCNSLSWNINWELRNGSRGLAFFLAGVRNQKITVQVPWGQDLKKKWTWAFQSLATSFFFKTFFRDSNLLQLLQSFKTTRKSIRRRLEGAFNQLVFTARGIVRAVLMSGKVQEIYRTAVIQNSLKPVWKEARNFRIGLDLLISFVSCINVAYMMWC